MQTNQLWETVTVKTVSETDTVGVFDIEGLYTGYGLTVGNALRRVLLSSLPGAAITQVKIKGVGHEFSTLPGVLEDVVEICVNLKKIRFRPSLPEPQIATLKVKGDAEVTAADIMAPATTEIITPDIHIATLTAKDAELDMELTIEPGLGYVPVEGRKIEKLPIGVVALDAFFSPVVKVNFIVENMRVGDRTDYNRLRFTIETDGSITPSAALMESATLLREHYGKVIEYVVPKVPQGAPRAGKGVKRRATKTSKKKAPKK